MSRVDQCPRTERLPLRHDRRFLRHVPNLARRYRPRVKRLDDEPDAADAGGMPRRILSGIAALAIASAAHAVVVADHDPLPTPLDGYVGDWNGSSAVCIAPNWIVSAKHVGGQVGGMFTIRGEQFRSVEIRQHAIQDIQLIRVAETLPGHHRIATGVAAGDIALLGGWGVTAGNAITNGYDWTGSRAETWGANTIDSAGSLLIIRFDNPTSSAAIPHEAIFAVNDSGAGLFTHGIDGSLELAGLAVSVTGFGQSLYGNMAYCLNMDNLRSWIAPLATPGTPVASSVAAPRE